MTRLVVVTGASSGVGRALALRLAAPGTTLVLVARRASELAAAARAVEARGGVAHVQAVDLSDPAAARAAAEEGLERWGVPDAVVANAGLSIRRSVLQTAERPDTVTRTIGVNYTGAVAHLLPFIAAMAERGSGAIVGVTSAPARLPGPGWGAYTASKAAFDAWLRAAAIELRGSGVSVTTVAFGLVATPMSEPTYGRRPPFALSAAAAAGWIVRALEHPGGRLAPWWVRPSEAVAGLFPGLADRLAGRAASGVGPRSLRSRRGARPAKRAPRRAADRKVPRAADRPSGRAPGRAAQPSDPSAPAPRAADRLSPRAPGRVEPSAEDRRDPPAAPSA